MTEGERLERAEFLAARLRELLLAAARARTTGSIAVQGKGGVFGPIRMDFLTGDDQGWEFPDLRKARAT